MTGGIKYWFLKNLLIPTGDDPERSSDGGRQQGGQKRQGGGGGGGQQQRSQPHQKAIDWISSTTHDERFPKDLMFEYRGRTGNALAFFAKEDIRAKINRFEDAAIDAAKALNAALKAVGSPLASEKAQGQGKQAPERSHPQAQPPKPQAPSTNAGDDRAISPAQEKRLWAIATKNGWTNDAVHLLLDEAQPPIEHTNEIPRSLYDELIKKLEIAELGERYSAEAEERAEQAPTSGPRSR
jgi:hypothetical protein